MKQIYIPLYSVTKHSFVDQTLLLIPTTCIISYTTFEQTWIENVVLYKADLNYP